MWGARDVVEFLVKSNPWVVIRFLVKSLGCSSFFGEVEYLGLVAVSFSLTLFLFLILTHFFSFLLFCPVL